MQKSEGWGQVQADASKDVPQLLPDHGLAADSPETGLPANLMLDAVPQLGCNPPYIWAASALRRMEESSQFSTGGVVERCR
jgi:hypothetical protein